MISKLSPSAYLDTFCRDMLPPQTAWPELSFDLPELQYPETLNCAAVLLDETISRGGSERPSVSSPDETWTYGELRARANKVARVLRDHLGLVSGGRVLLRGPNAPWLVACWLGVLKAGGVVVTTMPLLREKELRDLCGLTRPAIALCDRRLMDDLKKAGPDLRVLHYGSDGCDEAGGHDAGLCLNTLGSEAGEDFTDFESSADDVAMLAVTSGTTGKPKATMHFHRDVLAIADTFSNHVIKPRPSDVFTGTPPLAFTYGLGGLLVFPLRAGASTFLVERATPGEFAELAGGHGVTVISTAPTAFRAILRAGRASSLKDLRRAVSAGEHLPAAVWSEWFEATGVKIIDGLGSTEMLHVFLAACDEDIRPGSTGFAVPGYEAKVIGMDGEEVADGETGRLAARGPTGCRYLGGDRQDTYVENGWNITGDTYIRDSDGYFWYQARSDDMIVSSGYNIGAPEVELAVDEHPDVVESAVVGSPDQERGMVVHAFVVLSPGVAGDESKVRELQEFTKAKIAPYKYPRLIDFVDTLPRTGTGKLQRFKLK